MKIEDLVERAKAGDKEAFSELIDSVKHSLYTVARRKLSNEDDVQDVVQEAVIKAYLNIDRLKDNKRFKPWIERIVRNECNRLFDSRKTGLAKLNKFALSTNTSTYTNDDSDINFDSLINSLDDKERKIFELHYKYGLSLKEISKKLNINENSIKTTLSRGKIKLRRTIKPSLLMAILVICIASGVVAACVFSYIQELFKVNNGNMDNEGVLMAIEHLEWYQDPEMDYLDLGSGYSMKVDYLLMDEMNLYMVVDLKSENDISKFKNMYFPDLKITDENGNLICDENDLTSDSYSKKTTVQLIENDNFHIKALVYMYADSFPVSRKLNIEFSQLTLSKKSILGKNKLTSINANINYQIDLAEKFINRHSTAYVSSNEKLEKAIVTETGFYAIISNIGANINSIYLVDENKNSYDCYFSPIDDNDFKYIFVSNFNNTECKNLKLVINDEEFELLKN